MSMIRCPECGSKISSRATTCPFCGFQSNDSNRPISEQDNFEESPYIQYDIIGYNNQNQEDLISLSYDDNKTLIDYFCKWDNIKVLFPGIAATIQNMAVKDHYMIAKMDGYVKDLIDKGIYRFVIDKNGEILPTIRDASGFVKQVRLEDMTLAPNITQALNNLTMHAALAQIIEKIEYIGDAIRELHIELQDDRLAIAESAYDKFYQAKKIQDSRLRMIAILNSINTATDAKRTLMRNFSQNLLYINQHSNQSYCSLLRSNDQKTISQKVIDAYRSLIKITIAVQIESEGYAALSEYRSARECIKELEQFVEDNRLNDRDTLVLLNEHSTQKQIDFIDHFSEIKERLTQLDIIMDKTSRDSNLLLKENKRLEDNTDE